MSPRIKRSALSVVKARAGVDKCATGSEIKINNNCQINGRRCIKIGQWNVRGLNALGKLSILSGEMERLDVKVCGLSETKWTGTGHFTTVDGHTVMFSGGENREYHGVAIWAHKSISTCLMSYNPLSNRVIAATFAAKPRNITVMQCYAPTADKPDEEIEQFYNELHQIISETPKKNLLIITGDFNARVGENALEKDVLGKYGHGERNERGQLLVDFCSEHKLAITNTLFRVHNRHRYTWNSPDGVTRTQIDYILIKKQWLQMVNNARTHLSADCDTDHNLVTLALKMRFKNKRIQRQPAIDLGKLKSKHYREEYQIKVTNRFEELEGISEPNTPNELWQQLKNVTLNSAKETLQKESIKRKNWISEGTLELIEKKRAAKSKSTDEYRKLRSEVQKRLRKDKQSQLDALCNDIEENGKKGNSRPVFQAVKKLTKTFQAKNVAIKDKNGKKITEPEKVSQRWKEYCEELYDNVQENIEINIHEREPKPLLEEIRQAILKMASRKAPGPDDIAVELLKFGGEMTLKKLHEICLEVWETGIWPDEWTQSVFIPLPKKGDLLQCNNYRTIALVSHASKILLRVILNRLQSKLENEISQEQAGFRPRRGTRDQITNMRIILEKARERNQSLYFCFIDFTKAFDMVHHDQLWLTMLEMGFPPHLVQLLRNLYRQQRATVRTANLVSEWFRIRKGVRQGCNLSPCLFNILAEQIMRKALDGYSGGFKIGGKVISNLRYADDIVLVATSAEELQDLMNRVEKSAKEYNMLINATKTKVLSNTNETLNIKVEGGILEQVDTFTYLGCTITKNADCSSEIKSRMALGMSVMGKLAQMWRNKGISTATKLRLMKALVWPVATYGCEAWTLKKEDENRIQAFENKCVRKLLRIPWTKLMTNEQVYKMARTENELLSHIKSRKLRYFGHVMRLPYDNIEVSVMTGLVEGVRGRGRPRTAWFDNIIAWTGLSGYRLIRATRERGCWTALTHPYNQPS